MNDQDEIEKLFLLSTAVAFAGALYLALKLITKSQNGGQKHHRDGFKKVGKVKEIHFYPFKSCKKIPLSEAKMTSIGLAMENTWTMLDRSFMFYNPKSNSMVSAKYISRLVRLRAKIIGNYKLELSFDDCPECPVKRYPKLILDPTNPNSETYGGHLYRNINICSKPGNAIDCGDTAGEWVSEWLHKTRPTSADGGDDDNDDSTYEKLDLRVVFFDTLEDECIRDVEEVMAGRQDKIGRVLPKDLDYKTTLTDVASYTIHSLQSEQFVEKSISGEGFSPLNRDCWRSNIIVDFIGPESQRQLPFSEDNWRQVYIGTENENYKLTFYARVPRCTLPVVEPTTGISRPDGQPVRWLNKNRKIPDEEADAYGGGVQCHLGNYYAVGVENSGKSCVIRVGDWVYAKDK